MEIIPQKLFKAKVYLIEEMGEGIKKITFVVNSHFPFSVGQYVWVEIPKLAIDDVRGNRRAFSIFNIPNNNNTISIIARISESGYKKSLFSLAIDDQVIIHGAFGSSFTISDKLPKNIVMIAGGVGIAPFFPVAILFLYSTPAERRIQNKKSPLGRFFVIMNQYELPRCIKTYCLYCYL